MILSDKGIKSELGKSIIIDPYDESNLNPNSYNLHIGSKIRIVEFNGEGEIDGKHPSEFKLLTPVVDPRLPQKYSEIEMSESGYSLFPGRLYLASTVEFTSTQKYVPIISGRSSIGRLGLSIHVTAGFGDLGFRGHWTLELVATIPVKIYPNMALCQIYYIEATESDTVYNGKYLDQVDPAVSLLDRELG